MSCREGKDTGKEVAPDGSGMIDTFAGKNRVVNEVTEMS